MNRVALRVVRCWIRTFQEDMGEILLISLNNSHVPLVDEMLDSDLQSANRAQDLGLDNIRKRQSHSARDMP